MFEIPAGGRRYRALELLVKQKRLAKTAPVPCVVREGGVAEEDSLAENVQRVALHPLDQFRAFQALRDKGLGEEEIAARFFVSPTVVKQRLRLAAVSEKLLEVYAEDGMTLEQLMAFTVNGDHARQEQVWEGLSRSHNREPYNIRRQLTDGAVRASDRRARFVGVEAYEAAGGTVMRDLFQHDEGGWLQDPALLDRLVNEKLQTAAEALQAEGWKWISVAPDFPYGYSAGLRHLGGATVDLTEDERASVDALQAENEALEKQYAEADELPDEIDQRLGEIETALAAFDNRPHTIHLLEKLRDDVHQDIPSLSTIDRKERPAITRRSQRRSGPPERRVAIARRNQILMRASRQTHECTREGDDRRPLQNVLHSGLLRSIPRERRLRRVIGPHRRELRLRREVLLLLRIQRGIGQIDGSDQFIDRLPVLRDQL